MSMSSSVPVREHLSTAEHLISVFFRESERELSRLAQKPPSNSKRCDVEVIEFLFSNFRRRRAFVLTWPRSTGL